MGVVGAGAGALGAVPPTDGVPGAGWRGCDPPDTLDPCGAGVFGAGAVDEGAAGAGALVPPWLTGGVVDEPDPPGDPPFGRTVDPDVGVDPDDGAAMVPDPAVGAPCVGAGDPLVPPWLVCVDGVAGRDAPVVGVNPDPVDVPEGAPDVAAIPVEGVTALVPPSWLGVSVTAALYDEAADWSVCCADPDSLPVL